MRRFSEHGYPGPHGSITDDDAGTSRRVVALT